MNYKKAWNDLKQWLTDEKSKNLVLARSDTNERFESWYLEERSAVLQDVIDYMEEKEEE